QVQALGAATLNNVSGGPGVPAELLALARGTGSAVAPTNSLDPNFNLPSQWRISGSLDWRANLGFLGDDWRLGADVIWSSIKDSLIWTDLRSVPNTVQATLPDGRPRYQSLTGDNNTDIFLTNGSRGYSWNLVARVAKDWDNGFSFGMSYSLQRARDENPGTSSVAFSNYSNAAAEDPNFAAYGISNYQRDDSFRLRLGYEREFFGDNATRFDLFFNSLAGQRFSYTFQDRSPGQRRAIFGTTQRNDAYLIYVPDVSSIAADPRVTYANEATFAALRDFVLNSPLAKYQGQIAPKNIGQSPRFEKMDLRISQEIPFFLGGKIQLFADFENFLNMLNSDWGSLRQVSFPYLAPIVDVACPNPANPAQNITGTNQVCTQYRYSNFREPSQTNFVNISLWSLRLGVRLSF
ncbi:MAG: TonB-dependent receptor, partial [Thermaurantiacus sp.]